MTGSDSHAPTAGASLSAAEASHLGVEHAPGVVVEFDPYAPHPAKTTKDGTIVVSARYLSKDPSVNAFSVLHEAFHPHQRQAVDGSTDPGNTAESLARQLASQHAEDWGR